MPYSHHSHSGEFCNHATDQLEDVVQEAIRQGMEMFALTEHMPRNHESELYPGENEIGWSIPEQAVIFDRFYHKARELQTKYQGKIELLVGLEIDWIGDDSQEWIKSLFAKYNLDLFVGSVHHVHGIPIDYDQAHYDKAVKTCLERASSSSPQAEQLLFADYYDTQYNMLRALRPPVVGHFDLIRLLSKEPDTDWKLNSDIWQKITRNLRFICEYGGVLELNSSGLRKGMQQPYPRVEICQYFKSQGGHFVFSDDSHGIGQVGHSYEGLLKHARMSNIQSITIFRRDNDIVGQDSGFPEITSRSVSIDTVAASSFWHGRPA